MSLIHRVDSGGRKAAIFIGGRSDAKSREWLERNNITHILNVTPPKEAGIQAGVPNFFESKDKFLYKRIPVYDLPTSDLLAHGDAVVSFISKGLIHGNVLVHCVHGKSRSATCVAFYLMRRAGMSLEEALGLMQRKRDEVSPIPAFMEQLKAYEAKCQKGSKEQKRKRKRSQLGPSIGPSKPPSQREIGPSLPPKKEMIITASPVGSSPGKEEPSESALKSKGVGGSDRRVTKIGPELPKEAEEPDERKEGSQSQESEGGQTLQ